MTITTNNHYMKPADIINAMQMSGRNYIEIDGIRLVVEDGCVQGWYNPGEPKQTETNVPSEVTA